MVKEVMPQNLEIMTPPSNAKLLMMAMRRIMNKSGPFRALLPLIAFYALLVFAKYSHRIIRIFLFPLRTVSRVFIPSTIDSDYITRKDSKRYVATSLDGSVFSFDKGPTRRKSNPSGTPNKVRDFDLWKRIGKGGFGDVWMATKSGDDHLYAMKIIAKERLVKTHSIDRVIAEKKILQNLNHPFVISLRFAFQDKTKIYLVLDYIGGGDMFTLYHSRFPDTFSESEVRFYASEVTLALEHLHKQNPPVIYRDLKLENVLVGLDGHIVLTDFGVAKQSLIRSSTFVGTPHYMAPEIIANKEHGPEVDWWAMGVLCYELLVGKLPFRIDKETDLCPNTSTLTFPTNGITKRYRSFISQLLEPEIDKRLGTSAKVKSHIFMNSIKWEDVAAKKMKPPILPQDKTSLIVSDPLDFQDKFSRFTAYDSHIDVNERHRLQKLNAQKLIHPFFDTNDDDIAHCLASEIIDPNAIFYLQGREWRGIDGYLTYRKQLRQVLTGLKITVITSKYEGNDGGERVTVMWKLSARRVGQKASRFDHHGIISCPNLTNVGEIIPGSRILQRKPKKKEKKSTQDERRRKSILER